MCTLPNHLTTKNSKLKIEGKDAEVFALYFLLFFELCSLFITFAIGNK